MGRRLRASLVVLTAFVCFGPRKALAADAPILIMEFTGGGGGSGSSFPPPPPLEGGVVLTLEYDPYDGTLPTTKPFGIRAAIEIGDAAGMFFPGQTGTFDFNDQNSTDFGAVVARLTNGIDETLHTGTHLPRRDSGEYPFGGGGASTEGFLNRSTRDLVGVQIAFIRLIVKRVSFVQVDNFLEWSADAVWQVWGTAPGNVPPVANAGADQFVIATCGDCTVRLRLDGSGSYDPNGDPLRLSWTDWFDDPQRIPSTITRSPDLINANIFTFRTGRHVVLLTVRDDRGHSTTDEVIIDIRDNVDDLMAQLEAARSQLATAQAQLDSARNELNTVKTQLATAEATIASQTAQLATVQAQLTASQAQLDLTRNELDATRTELSTAQATIASQGAQIVSLQQSIASLNASMSLDVARVQSDFRSTFRDPSFVIPGRTPLEQLQNLLDAVVALDKAQKRQIYKALR